MTRKSKYLVVFIILLLTGINIQAQQSVTDSLLTRLEETPPNGKGQLLIHICHELSKTQPAKMKEYAEQLVNIGKETNNSSLEITGYYNLGMSLYLQSDFSKGYVHFLDAFLLSEQVKNDSLAIKSLNVMAVIQARLGNYPKALEHFKRLEAISFQLKMYDENSIILMNIGNCFKFTNQNDSAEFYYLKGYELAQKHDLDRSFAYLGNNLAFFYSERGKHQLGEKFIQEALSRSLKNNDNELIMECLATYSQIELNLNKLDASENYAVQVLQLADSINAREQKRAALFMLYQIFDKKKDKDKALDYYIRYSNVKDSIYNSTTSEQIQELTLKYETEKKEQLILTQKAEIKNSNQRLVLMSVLLVVSIASLFIIVFLYINKNKAYQVLVRKNLEVVETEFRLKRFFTAEENIVLPVQKKYKKSSLSEDSKEQNEKQLTLLLEDRKLWLQSDVSVEKIASILGTNSKYLSQIINQAYQQSFPNFINELRIKEARRMLISDEYSNYTIEGIGQLTGFNSKSSFIAAFKKYTGLTPSYFRDSHKASINQ